MSRGFLTLEFGTEVMMMVIFALNIASTFRLESSILSFEAVVNNQPENPANIIFLCLSFLFTVLIFSVSAVYLVKLDK